MFRLKPETAHEVAMLGLRLRSLLPVNVSHDPRLAREVFGLRFPNPVGLAAGFDKNAVALPAWEALGFGFVEAGTVTAKAQPGNPKPRVFRLPEQRAVINRMGFNNDGADAVAARLERLRAAGRWPQVPVGINIGKSRVAPVEEAAEDYLLSFERLFPFADYFALNVSSPNTPGLRSLQDRDALDVLLSAVQAKNAELGGKPVLVKIAPDLEFSQIGEILALAEGRGLAGIIATNTTLDHSSVPAGHDEQGGLSGAPVRQRSTEIVRFITSRTKLPVIAVGGIEDASTAREKLDAGAALVQLYTGFIYRGPSLPREICRALRG